MAATAGLLKMSRMNMTFFFATLVRDKISNFTSNLLRSSKNPSANILIDGVLETGDTEACYPNQKALIMLW